MEYLPELKVNDNSGVLVHHLLTHTAGWEDEDLDASRERLLETVLTEPTGDHDLLEHIVLATGIPVPRRRTPGEAMSYSNFNYTLIGEIIRRVTGEKLDAVMRRFVFEPVGMDSSAVIVSDELLPRVVERPPGIPGAPDHPSTVVPFYDPLWFAWDDGGAGVHATPLDNLRFLEMVRNGGVVGTDRVLSPASIRVMTTNQIPGVRGEIRLDHDPRGVVELRIRHWQRGSVRRSTEAVRRAAARFDMAAAGASARGSTPTSASPACTTSSSPKKTSSACLGHGRRTASRTSLREPFSTEATTRPSNQTRRARYPQAHGDTTSASGRTCQTCSPKSTCAPQEEPEQRVEGLRLSASRCAVCRFASRVEP